MRTTLRLIRGDTGWDYDGEPHPLPVRGLNGASSHRDDHRVRWAAALLAGRADFSRNAFGCWHILAGCANNTRTVFGCLWHDSVHQVFAMSLILADSESHSAGHCTPGGCARAALLSAGSSLHYPLDLRPELEASSLMCLQGASGPSRRARGAWQPQALQCAGRGQEKSDFLRLVFVPLAALSCS